MLPQARPTTPEEAAQLAAVTDLRNGWTRQRVIEGIAAVGTIEEAARIAGYSPWSVYKHIRDDPTFAEQVDTARKRFGEKLLGKSVAAVLAADPEQLVRTPTLAIAAVNWYNPELRPNGPTVNIDARTQNAILMAPEQLEQLSALYMKTARQHDSASSIEGAEAETE